MCFVPNNDTPIPHHTIYVAFVGVFSIEALVLNLFHSKHNVLMSLSIILRFVPFGQCFPLAG